MFDRLLLGRLRADKDQTWREGRGPVPKGAKAIGFHGNQIVATQTRKRSHSSAIDLLVLKFHV